MSKASDILNDIFNSNDELEPYKNLGLKFNPFPKSGTANINSSDLLNQSLIPADENVLNRIQDYLKHAFRDNVLDPQDKFISATITGDYGSGKTQILMFVKSILGQVSTKHQNGKNPYVIYIDNPGVKLSELVGSIISQIGEENFKKFIWNKVINQIRNNSGYKSKLERFKRPNLFSMVEVDTDPFSEKNTVSYRNFLDSFASDISKPSERKEFDEIFREIIVEILEKDARNLKINPLIAEYFYELISSDFGVNKTWEALSTGSIKQLDKKEADIIRYIVQLIKEQGFTDFFILVDEFEDVTKNRLTKAQLDNYIHNLRTLLDQHREWSLFFSMTSEALRQVNTILPALHDRITIHRIILQKLNVKEATKVVQNYLNLARDSESEQTKPFTLDGIERLNELSDGNTRRFLKNCFLMIEKAAGTGTLIDSAFVDKYFPNEDMSF